MTTTATHNGHDTLRERVVFVTFALRDQTGKLAFTIGHGQKPRERTVAARHQARLHQAVTQATKRFGLPETAPVVRCCEASRAGFWRQRFVPAQRSTTSVVDASSLAVHRRQRRAQSDGWDMRQLVRLLMRYA